MLINALRLEVIVNFYDLLCLDDKSPVIEPVIPIVVNDSATNAIQRLATFNKTACSFARGPVEQILCYIEQFFLPTQAYLNFTRASRSSAKSQDLTMTLISKDNLTQDTFSALMSNPNLSTKSQARETIPSIPIDVSRMEVPINLLAELSLGDIEKVVAGTVRENWK